jgi:predicted nucleic acid-binding protein
MPVVIADASPVRYLVLIGEAQILNALYGRLIIAATVAHELIHAATPAEVRSWISNTPSWLEIVERKADVSAHLSRGLDPGERDTILLAIELAADLVLMDDREGVTEARRLGLHVTGTLGVLDRAAQLELVDLPDACARLRATNFRVSPTLLERLIEEHRRR